MPTAAAMRAAAEIMDTWDVGERSAISREFVEPAESKVAEIIDEATGLPEVTLMCRAVLASLRSWVDGTDADIKSIKRALAKLDAD